MDLPVACYPSISPVSGSRTRGILVPMPALCSSFARLTAFCVSLFAICIPICSSAAALAQPAPTTPAPFVAESLGNGALPVDGAWQFHLGDNLAWAQPGIEDATGHDGWEEIKTDAPWGAQSHPNYAGYAWYRRHIQIRRLPELHPMLPCSSLWLTTSMSSTGTVSASAAWVAFFLT